MPRPKARRWIVAPPDRTWFKPTGVPLKSLLEVVLELDELEAIRLAHLEGLYQDAVAERMNVSRQTVGRILDSAHRKVAEALTYGKALRLRGGKVRITMQGDPQNKKGSQQGRNLGPGTGPRDGSGPNPNCNPPGQGRGGGGGRGFGGGGGQGRGQGFGSGRGQGRGGGRGQGRGPGTGGGRGSGR